MYIHKQQSKLKWVNKGHINNIYKTSSSIYIHTLYMYINKYYKRIMRILPF